MPNTVFRARTPDGMPRRVGLEDLLSPEEGGSELDELPLPCCNGEGGVLGCAATGAQRPSCETFVFLEMAVDGG